MAFLVYKIMITISDDFRKIKSIPIIGSVDCFLGAILGIAEAVLIIALIEYATDIDIVTPVLTTCYEIILFIQKSFINK